MIKFFNSKNLLIKNFKKSPLDYILPSLLFVFVFSVYLHNLSPSIYGYDSGDFATAIMVKGVPHPSGYPLYTMLGIIFNSLPIGETPAWRIGLVSVFASAFGVVLAYLTVNELVKNKIAGLFAGLSVAFFYPYWLYAEVVEVMALNSFFVLLLIFLTVKFHLSKKLLYFYLLCLSMGLSLTNNLVIILMFPGILIVLIANWNLLLNAKTLIKGFFLFLSALLPYAYLPIAASQNPEVNTGNPSNLQNFINVVTRKSYGWGSSLQVPFELKYTNVFFFSVSNDLRIIPFFAAAIGTIFFIKKKFWTILIFLLISFTLTGPFYFFYARTYPEGFFQVGQLERFVISASIILIISLSVGVSTMSKIIDKFLNSIFKKINNKAPKRMIYPLALVIFLIYPLNLFLSHFPSTNLSDVWVGDNLGNDMLLDLPENSILVIYDDAGIFNSKYIHILKRNRKDIFIPSSSSDFISYIKKDKRLNEAGNYISSKYTGIEKNNPLYLLLTLRETENPVFYLTIPDYDKKKFSDIRFKPHGLLLEMIKDNSDLSKEKFIEKQENLFSKMHTKELKDISELAKTNYNFIHISSLYSAAYKNTSTSLDKNYNDLEAANKYHRISREINPLID